MRCARSISYCSVASFRKCTAPMLDHDAQEKHGNVEHEIGWELCNWRDTTSHSNSSKPSRFQISLWHTAYWLSWAPPCLRLTGQQKRALPKQTRRFLTPYPQCPVHLVEWTFIATLQSAVVRFLQRFLKYAPRECCAAWLGFHRRSDIAGVRKNREG